MNEKKRTWFLELPEELFREAERNRYVRALDVLQEWSAKDLEYQETFPFKEDLYERTSMDFFEDEITDLFVMHDYAMNELTDMVKNNASYDVMDDDEKANWLGDSLEKIYNVLLDEFCLYGNKAKYYEIVHTTNQELDQEIMSSVIDDTYDRTMDAVFEEAKEEANDSLDEEAAHYAEKKEETEDEEDEGEGDKPRSVRL